jgi:hypothetical protein
MPVYTDSAIPGYADASYDTSDMINDHAYLRSADRRFAIRATVFTVLAACWMICSTVIYVAYLTH